MIANVGRKIIANVIDAEEIRVALLDARGRLDDLYVERMWERQRTGEIYKARVDSVLPGMHSAFLNLGDGRNGFLYLNDVRDMQVKQGTEMIVQVVKNARRGKGARVSPRVSLAGRFLVIIPGGNEIGVSKRIYNEEERLRLRALAKELRPNGYGLIIRTVAEGAEEESLRRDVDELLQQWDEIEANAKRNAAPCMLHRDIGLLERILRDQLTEDVIEIVVDSEEEKKNLEEFLPRFSEHPPEVNWYRGAIPLFEVYNIEREIELLQDRKVWLNSGAYLIIDQTEALTVIDVNTGKFIGSKDLRDTVLKTNLEAAGEIVRQMRLRALGGIVVIDFIDMDSLEDRNHLIGSLQDLFRDDRCRARVYGVTGLGLVEITRKRARSDLRSVMSRGCPFCGGLGWVAREESVAMDLKRFIRKILHSSRSEAFLIEVHPAIARYVAQIHLSSWEEEFERAFFIREGQDFSWGKFRLESQGTLQQLEHRIVTMKKREGLAVVHRATPA